MSGELRRQVSKADVAPMYCASVRRDSLLPAFGSWPLGVISRGDVRALVAKLRSENPTLTPKTIKNIVGLLGALLEYAARDYELIASNPIQGMLAKARRLIPLSPPADTCP